MIKVLYSNGEELTYENRKEAVEEILSIMADCDFEVRVDYIEEVSDDGTTRQLFCQWGLELFDESQFEKVVILPSPK